MKAWAKNLLADGDSIKSRVIRSGLWVVAASAFGTLLSIFRSVLLARLLTPDIFGVMGLAGIVLRALETLTQTGISQALIARRECFQDSAGTAFTLLALRGVVLAALLAVLAPLVARFYQADQLETVIQVLACILVINGFQNINTVLRYRELEFRVLTYLNVLSNTIATAATISAAVALRSIWALVIGQIVLSVTNSALSYLLIEGKPDFRFSRQVAAELLNYGKFITGSSALVFIATELGSAVVGKLLGMEQLGFYTLALTIVFLITTNVAKIASSVVLPAYSKLRDDIPSLQRAYKQMVTFIVFITLPMSAGMALLAAPIVTVVYGAKWLPAAVPLQVLSLFGFFSSLSSLASYLLQGLALPKIAFYLAVFRFALIAVLIVPMTKMYGLVGAACGAVAGIVLQVVIGITFIKRHIGIGHAQVIAFCWPSIRASATMGVGVVFVSSIVNVYDPVGLAATILSGVVLYAAISYKYILAVVFDLRSTLRIDHPRE